MAAIHSPLPQEPGRFAVEIDGLVKVFGKRSAPVEAARRLADGEPRRALALLGKSGSGKSTLLGLLGGLDRPTSGTIRVTGRDLPAFPPTSSRTYRLAEVGMIFQAYNLIPSRTAMRNVALPMILAGRRSAERRRPRASARGSGLGHRMLHRPVELSGGEHQRVAMPGRWSTAPACSWPTSPRATSTRPPPRRSCSSCWTTLTRMEPP